MMGIWFITSFLLLAGLHPCLCAELPTNLHISELEDGVFTTETSSIRNASSLCTAALNAMFPEPLTNDAKLALDAFGRPEPGFLIGNLAWFGHYSECMSLSEYNYCVAYIRTNATFGDLTPIRLGMCVPKECDETDLSNSIGQIIDYLHFRQLSPVSLVFRKVYCTQSPPRPYDAGFYAMVILCTVLGGLVLAGAILDQYLRIKEARKQQTAESMPLLYFKKGNSSPRSSHQGSNDVDQNSKFSGCVQILQQTLFCFAFNRNLTQVLSTKTKEGNILCLNGIRVISMSWIILGHVVLLCYSTYALAWDGILEFGWLSHFGFQAVINAYPAVDSFFFLSGLLVTYITLGRMSKSDGSMKWGYFYLHRYWRLFPALSFTMLFQLYLQPYLAEGPLSQEFVRMNRKCDKYWWTNLLYINNFYPREAIEGCIYWVWYLANDMQFYLISPILLVALYRKPRVGFTMILALCIASLAATIAIMAINDYQAILSGLLDPNNSPGHNLLSDVYVKPYCRIPPYLVGMVMGYTFYVWRGRKIRMSKILVVIGWMVSTATGLAVVYGLYGAFHGHQISTAENALYISLVRLAWGCIMAWLVFACYYGYGGWINRFLSWNVWLPLSRLTYSAYLFHPIVIQIFIANTSSAFHMNSVYFAFYFIGAFVFSYGIALLVALGLEIPMANLEGLAK